MSSTNDSRHPNQSANLYTIYPGSIPTQDNVNYGFYSSHPLAPPPKYEDVISGRALEQPSMPPYAFPLPCQQETGQTRVVLIAPESKVMGKSRKPLLFFVLSFFAGFIIVLLWKLRAE